MRKLFYESYMSICVLTLCHGAATIAFVVYLHRLSESQAACGTRPRSRAIPVPAKSTQAHRRAWQ
jgi:hypothetical protein